MKKALLVAFLLIGSLDLLAQTSDGLAATHHTKKPEPTPNDNVEVFYNYMSKGLNITQPDPTAWLTVQRITGHVVLSHEVFEKQTEVSLVTFHTGLYVYKLITSSGKSVKGKFEIR